MTRIPTHAPLRKERSGLNSRGLPFIINDRLRWTDVALLRVCRNSGAGFLQCWPKTWCELRCVAVLEDW